jgi:long-chain acyl-CoA synthetase
MPRPWYHEYPEGIPISPVIPEIPLSRYVRENAEKYPNRTAMIFFGKKISFREFERLVSGFAGTLQSLGVQKGTRVATLLPNSPQVLITYYAVLRLGGILVQFNPLYVEHEIEFQLNDSGAEVAVVFDQMYPKVKNVRDKTPLKTVIVTGVQDFLPFPKNWLYPLTKRRDRDFVRVSRNEPVLFMSQCLNGRGQVKEDVRLDVWNDPALFQYTGGTTGTPKGVVLTHGNLMANLVQVREWIGRSREGEEVMLVVLPIFHAFGMTVCMNLSTRLGFPMILIPRFRVKEVLEAIRTYRPTLFIGIPPMFKAINHFPGVKKYDLTSIRYCISGASALSPDVKKRFQELTGSVLIEGYGLTEASPVTHCNPLYSEDRPGSIGLPLPGTDCKVVDPDTGGPVEPGAPGEMIIKGPQVMKGYWNRPEETAQVLKNGWLYTGDIVQMDERGYLYVVDRKKDMIIYGGINIYPKEIEEWILTHPKISEVAVIGIPDEVHGEKVVAVVVPKPGEEIREKEIVEYCKRNFAGFKIPKKVVVREELPKSIVGKVLKRILREELSAHKS